MSSTSKKNSNRLATNGNSICSVFGIKAAIIIVGFIMLVGVLSLLYMSLWTIVTKHKYAILTSAYLYTVSTYVLSISTLVTLISIIALFIVAWIEHQKGLKITLIVLIATFILEIACGLLSFGYTVNLNERLSKNLLLTIEQKYLFDPKRTESFDQMQKRFHCCGSISFKDWQLNPNFNSSMNSAVPDSCCKSFETRCARKPYGRHPSNIYYKGCSSALYRFYYSHLIKLGSVALSVALLQVLIILLLFWLIKRIRKLASLENSLLNSTKNRRSSNEITYHPIQSSKANK